MKTGYLLTFILSLGLLALSGCGGGSNGSGGTTTVSGVASKGIFTGGTVKVYALNSDGSKGTLLNTVSINADGSYTAAIGGYAGPVLTEASGSYTDEATGTAMQVSENAPLRAAVQNASGNVQVAITPLTEIAVRKATDTATSKITVASIGASNALVATVFHVADIVATRPVDVTSTASATASTAQKEYSLALAAVSQMMKDNGQDLATVVSQVSGAITGSGSGAWLEGSTAAGFQAALQTFVSDTEKNKTGVTDASSTGLAGVGATTATVRLSTQGSATALNGIQVTLALPAGVTVRAASSDGSSGLTPLAGLVSATGVVPAGSTLAARYDAPTDTATARLALALVSVAGFPAGEFATIICNVAPGVTISSVSFTPDAFSNLKAVDESGTVVPGVTISAVVTQ
ncbi:hypothetical protein [Geobacter sp. SVR]|uniref:hypothetical protein n=1 Tax=Geobacter sp. SVR TaxID=2495594 RepID=UPI00143F03D7|nr:hypothetical protein [Geobacter sp. SVR]BCS55759.1 hypothetical protein GSVR_40670 [Geobacter sp. SVR]GCF83763.1 hypothetical protein GSbR_03630 [Geobacter sp. SVR]